MVDLRPVGVEVEVSSRVRATDSAQALEEAPGGLYPLMSRAFELDDYRTMAGWPVSVPKYDIKAYSMISATGEVLAAREDNTAIRTGALLRWIADSSSYDETSLLWTPHQDGTGQNPRWATSAEFAPTLINNYEYRVKNEVFRHSALNFDSDTRNHMWIDFSTSIGGSGGYTVIMVISPNSTYGNNVDVPYNGIWCPGGETPAGETFAEPLPTNYMGVTMQGRYLWLETESTSRARGIAIDPELNTNAPMYLAMVFSRPEFKFYAATGPANVRIESLPSGSISNPLNDSVVLGRSTGDILHTADMALLDLNIYANRLTGEEIMAEFAVLSRSYGGDQ